MALKTSSSPHDHYFREQFSKIKLAKSYFQNYLPANVKELIDWNQFKLAPTDFVQKALKNRRSDILYQTRIKKQKCFFYLHLEHQRTPDPRMVYRVLVYMVHIIEQHIKQYPGEKQLPLVMPMVFYQGKQKWNAPLSFHELLDVPESLKPFIPQFEYSLLDISHLSDQQIQGEITLQLMLHTLKRVDDPAIEEYLETKFRPLLIELLKKKSGLEYIESMLYYLSNTAEDLNKDNVIHFFQNLPADKAKKDKIMTLAEQWIHEGYEKGIEKGIEKGHYGFIEKQLNLKFKKSFQSFKHQLEHCTRAQLEVISERILTCDKVEDIFKGFNKK